MRTLVLVMCALAIGGCANKRTDAAVDRYINQELAPHLAKILAARAGYDDVKADDVESPDNLANLTHRLTDAALPLLTQAADGLSKLTPPPSIEYLHAGLLDIAKEEQAAVADMSAALAPVDVAKFKAGHDRLMSIQERVVAWEGKLDTALREHAVTMKPLPDVDIPKPREHAPTPAAAGFAAPCDPATKVVTGGAVVECTLTEGYKLCGAGKATFHPNGEPRTCTSEMMFAPPETEAGTPKDQVVVCGPGELTRSADGVVEACTLASELMVGTTRAGKGAKVTLGAKAKVTSVILGDGLVIKP